MLKRILCVIMSILTLHTPVWAEEQAIEQSAYSGFGYEHKINLEEAVLFMDFEQYNLNATSVHGFSDLPYGTFYPKEGMDSRTSFAAAGASEAKIDFDNPITEGMYVLSFDLRRAETSGWCYIRMNRDLSNQYDSFGVSGTSAGYNHSWSISGAKKINANEWFHVNMFMDFDKNIVYYYINNEYSSKSVNLPDLHSFNFMMEGSANQVTSIDNLTMFELTTTLRKALIEEGIELPDEIKNDIAVEIGSKYVGNLFTSFEDVKMDVTLTNSSEEDIKYDISYYAKSYRGDIVWQGEEKNQELKGKEIKVLEFYPTVDKYDIYTMFVMVIPHTDGAEEIKTDKEFSVANVPTPGYKADYIGACIHPDRWAIWSDIKRSVDISGIGILRTDSPWSMFETKTGVYDGRGLPEVRDPNFYQDVVDMGMESIAIFYPRNSLYVLPEYSKLNEYTAIAKNPVALEALEKAAEQFALKYKGRISAVELGNELNFARIQAMSPEEYALICTYAYRGLKKGNPDVVVISQGISRSAGDWIYRFLTATKEPVCDVVGVHLYQEAGTPESKDWDVYIDEVREGMKRAGYGDMPMWHTEGNTSAHFTYSTEQQHGVNLIRQLIYIKEHTGDKFVFYQWQTEERNPSDIESYFGVMRGLYASNNVNAPKQTYLALTNYIAMTENAGYVDKILEDNIWVHRLKKPNGKYVLMMYSDRQCKTVSLDLGANSGILYDVNGNPQNLVSDNGKYTFSIADQPVYFEYSGENFERVQDLIVCDKNMQEVTLDDEIEFNLNVPEGAVLDVVGRDNMTVNANQDGSKAIVKIKINKMPKVTTLPGIGNVADVDYIERRHDFGTQLYRDYVNVYVRRNNQVESLIKLPVEYVFQSADVSMTVFPYDNTNTEYWKGIVTVKNNTTHNLSGEIYITEPVEISEGVGTISITDIMPGEEKQAKFNIPKEYSTGWRKYGGVFRTSDGEEIKFALADVPRSIYYKQPSSVAIGVIEKTKNKTPIIDGVIDVDEWMQHKITDFDKSAVSYGSQGIVIAGVAEQESFGKDADYGGKADLSGSIYSQWDDDYFYAAAIIYDDVHFQKQDPVRFYYEDMFYVELVPTTTQRHDTRIEFALSEFFEDERYTDAERHGDIHRNWSQMFDVPAGGVMDQSENGCKVFIERKENVTIYEVRIPWDELLSQKTRENMQTCLNFGIRDYDGDRDKTFGWNGWFVFTDTKN